MNYRLSGKPNNKYDATVSGRIFESIDLYCTRILFIFMLDRFQFYVIFKWIEDVFSFHFSTCSD